MIMKTYIFNINKIFFWLIIVVFSANSVYSQQDSMKKRTVLITSIFKPVLKEAAKINLAATPASVDTSKPKLSYNIPNQNLLFPYSPASIKPLALDIDLGGVWQLSNSIKAGFGNLITPFFQAGLSFGDGNSQGIQIYSKFISSSSKKNFQNYSEAKIGATGFYKTNTNHELQAKLEASRNNYNINKYPVVSMPFPQEFLNLNTRLGYHNTSPTKFGLMYSPEISVYFFEDDAIIKKNKEQYLKINLPLQKQVGKSFAVYFNSEFNFINYVNSNSVAVSKTVFEISPTLHLKTPKLNLQLGIRPTWDNDLFKLFPNIKAEVSTEDKRFVFQAGWTGKVQVNTYQSLAKQNQWINAPFNLQNTWMEERYAGFKGSVGNHFNYSTKLGFNKYKNLPLFDQDFWVSNFQAFNVKYEPNVKVVHTSAEIGYSVQEKLSLLATVNHYQYSNIVVNKKPLGLIPLEFKATFRLQVMDDVWINSDLLVSKGSFYRKSISEYDQLKDVFDFNAGVEYRVTKKVNLWAQFNNIFNQEFQRWNLFPSYGFNFVAGVIFSFDKNKK